MKYDCDMIRDLLPLYQDNVCSESSRAAVEEHLQECWDCTDFLRSLRQSGEIEEAIDLERQDALSSQARFFKRRSAVAGTVLAGLFMLPVVICLIVGLASGGISWVLIVLAAMLIPASLFAVPLLAPENKALWTLSSFAVSLVLLLGVCSAVSGRAWFFIAAPAVLFGLSVIFAPAAVRAKPVAKLLGSRKGLAVMALDTGLYLLMLLCIGLVNGLGVSYYGTAAAVSAPVLGLLWGSFLTARYLKAGVLIKTAAVLGLTGLVMIISSLIFRIGDYSALVYIEAFGTRFTFSPLVILAAILIAAAAVCALIGALTGKRRKD